MVLYIAHDALLFKPKFKSKLINNLYTWIKSRSWIEVCHTFLLTYLFFLGCLSNLPFPLFSCMNDFPCVETFFSLFWCFPSEAKIFIKSQFEYFLTVAEANEILIGFWLRNVEILVLLMLKAFLVLSTLLVRILQMTSKFFKYFNQKSAEFQSEN